MNAVAQRSHTSADAPYTDVHTTMVLEQAMRDLAHRRVIPPSTVWNPTVQLHLLASLLAQAERWLCEEVDNAHATGASWATIGRLLGLPATLARQRYSPKATGGHNARPASVTNPRNRMMPLEIE